VESACVEALEAGIASGEVILTVLARRRQPQMLVFGVLLQWLPVLGYVSPFDDLPGALRALVLPAFALVTPFIAETGRQTREAMREALHAPHIRTGRAKGLPGRTLLLRYVLRTASLPIIAVLGLQFGRLFAASVVIESIFLIPGLGRLVVDSIMFRDFPMVQGCVALIATFVALGNVLADAATVLIDPRQLEA
jgi:peptide/nickel transport system permease protein